MSSEEKFDLLFKALGHRMRRQLLDMLTDGPKTTGALCEALSGADRCTVMLHLQVLENAGLIAVERRGRERWNHLDAMPILDLQKRWIGPYAERAAAALGHLRDAVEHTDASPGKAGKVSVDV